MTLATTIRALLDSGGINVKQNSRSFILKCPRCLKRDKVYIRKTDGKFVCWVCKESHNFKGSCEWLLTELLGTPVETLRAALYGGSNPVATFIELNLHDFFGEDDEIPLFVPDPLPPVEPDPGFRPLAGSKGEEYLVSRGLTLEVCQQYDIQYWPAQKSVVFPVITNGQLVGWQTRRVGPTEYTDPETGIDVKVPKALTSVGLKKERIFMFGDRIRGEHAILGEGPVDALKAHLCGGNVASLGKVVSQHQLNLLRYSGIKRLYLALDPDAFIESQQVLKEMARDVEVYDMRPPKGYSDLGAMSMEHVKDLYLSAPRLDSTHLFLYLKDLYAK